MPEKIDYRKLKSPADVRLAREKLKYGLALQEQIVSGSFASLGKSINDMFRSAAYGIGARLAYALVSSLLHKRR